MDVEQALHDRLRTQVTAVNNRVAAVPAPDSWPVPLVVHQLISGAPVVTAGGVQRWWQPFFQVTVWAANYESMMTVTAQVRAALSGWGAVFNPGGLTVEYTWIESQRDLEDRTIDPPLVGRAFDVIMSCEGGC